MRFETVCTAHGKRVYRNRRDAQAAAKVIPGPHMAAYRCDHVDGGWHLGHLPRKVVRGLSDRRGYEASVARRQVRAS